MKPRPVAIRHAVHLPLSPAPALAWLTDYRDDDGADVGVVRSRKVVEHGPGRYVLDEQIHIVGIDGHRRLEVRIQPPSRYTATAIDGLGKGTVTSYHLSPEGAGSRLEIDIRVSVRRWKSWWRTILARRAYVRDVKQTWDEIARRMASEHPS